MVPSAPPFGVCIVSPHLFVIQELSRVMAGARVPASAHQITYSLAPRLECACPADHRVLVVDACLPLQSTESLVRDLRGAHPGRPVVVVAEDLSEGLVFPLLRAGVRGFLTYEDARARLPQAVAAVAQGRTWMPRGHLAAFLELLLGQSQPSRLPPGWLLLSQREKDVLSLLLKNLSNKEIGSRLNIAERTVKFHVSNLLSKFGVERRSDLILQALSGPQPA